MSAAGHFWWSRSGCSGMHPRVMDAFTLVEMNHTGGGGVQEQKVGFFLSGLKSVGVKEPLIFFISASLEVILCLAAEACLQKKAAERTESNPTTFRKK